MVWCFLLKYVFYYDDSFKPFEQFIEYLEWNIYIFTHFNVFPFYPIKQLQKYSSEYSGFI
jgi:hypothetical protein